MSGNKRIGSLLSFMVCLVVAALIGLLFAKSTSPLQPHNEGWDSLIFKTVGKLWSEGMIPYRQVFDHKGPLLFLIERLGFSLPLLSPRLWIYLAETLFNGTTLWLSLLILNTVLQKKWLRYAALLPVAAYWITVLEYGNLCEEYSLPFVMISLYRQIRYYQSGKTEHPPRCAFLYGLCFGLVFMIRANNGLLIAVTAFLISVRLMAGGKWKNLLANAGAMSLGFAVAVLPFIAYFAVKNSLPEMVYAVWTYNLRYMKNGAQTLNFTTIRQNLFFLIPVIMSMGSGFVNLIRKRWIPGLCGVFAGAVTGYMCLNGMGYPHYYMMAIPLIPFSIYLLMQGNCRFERVARYAILLVLIPGIMVSAVRTVPKMLVHPETSREIGLYEDFEKASNELVSMIPEEDRQSVSLLGYSSDLRLFLRTELKPVGRFCFLQSWHAAADPEIEDYITGFYNSGEAAYIIHNIETALPREWETAVQNNYELVSTVQGPQETWQLYRRIPE